jgi:hypothetical protein
MPAVVRLLCMDARIDGVSVCGTVSVSVSVAVAVAVNSCDAVIDHYNDHSIAGSVINAQRHF